MVFARSSHRRCRLNRGFAIVGLTNKGSSSVFQFGFCARVELTEYYCPTIAKP